MEDEIEYHPSLAEFCPGVLDLGPGDSGVRPIAVKGLWENVVGVEWDRSIGAYFYVDYDREMFELFRDHVGHPIQSEDLLRTTAEIMNSRFDEFKTILDRRYALN